MGAHFKALNEAVLMALAKILENFFPFRVSQPLSEPFLTIFLKKDELPSDGEEGAYLIRINFRMVCFQR